MESIIVAVPAANVAGLDAPVDAHFGHCTAYTLVTIEDGQVASHSVLPSIPHEQGGCMAPVNYLADNGVQVLISGGMGMRPLMGFEQVGIQVFHGADAVTVKDAVSALVDGKLSRFAPESTCGGATQGGCDDH